MPYCKTERWWWKGQGHPCQPRQVSLQWGSKYFKYHFHLREKFLFQENIRKLWIHLVAKHQWTSLLGGAYFFFYIFDISPKFCQLSIVSCCHQFDLVPLSKIQNSKRKLKIKPPFGILETFHLQIMQAGIKPGRGCAWTAHCVQLHLVKPGSACV